MSRAIRALGVLGLVFVLACDESPRTPADAGPDGPASDGPISDGTMSDGPAPDGLAPDGAPAPDAAAEGGTPDAALADSGPWSAPFLGRTPSQPIHLTNCSGVTISGKQFVNVSGNAIIVENCDNVTITENDFDDVVGAVYALNCTNVTVTWNRYRDVGDGTIGSGHSNFVQFNSTTGGLIAHNKGIGGNTEDIISIYKSGGKDTANPLVIEHNAFEGTTWTSDSGSGLMLGDAGGSHIVARFNVLLSPGQVGIGVASGTDIHVTDNTIYGATRPKSNVGIYVWNQYSTTCSGIEVTGNKVKWFKADGAENPSWDGQNCGTITGWSSNDWHATLDPATMHVTL